MSETGQKYDVFSLSISLRVAPIQSNCRGVVFGPRQGLCVLDVRCPARSRKRPRRIAASIHAGRISASQRTVSVADPPIPPDFAVIVAVPALSPVASPLLLRDATGFGDDDQVIVLVRSLVLPLL